MTTLAPHPARFSDPILDVAEQIILQELARIRSPHSYPLMLLDVFAGTGRVHELSDRIRDVETYGVEIEPEWAAYHRRTSVGNALALPDHWTDIFDFVFTSPTYGNRMADHHNAKDSSKRITYKHKLGRDPHPESSATLHFGQGYEEFHRKAWSEVARVLRHHDPCGGLFILNVSDFIRRGERVRVCDFHVDTILSLGFDLEQEIPVQTRRMGFGANNKLRVEHEMVYAFRRM